LLAAVRCQGAAGERPFAGNRKPDYRVSFLRKMEAVMLQNRTLGIGAQHFDAVDKEGAALLATSCRSALA